LSLINNKERNHKNGYGDDGVRCPDALRTVKADPRLAKLKPQAEAADLS